MVEHGGEMVGDSDELDDSDGGEMVGKTKGTVVTPKPVFIGWA